MITVAVKPDLLFRIPVAERVLSGWIPPNITETRSPDAVHEEAAFRALGRQASGRLIWSSNRGGNHDIYEADLATGRITQLTHHPNVDYFPRYSPDGRLISFLRTRKTWSSFRESGASDLFIMNADGSNERRLAEHADHATWAPDGRGLVFIRVADNRIMRLDLASGREATLYAGDDSPTNGRVNDPALGPDGRLALTLRDVPRKRRGVGIINLETREYRPLSDNPGACQVSWTPGDVAPVWVESRVLRGTRVMRTESDGSAGVFIDLPSPYTYEYFPRLSSDQRWLLWGASAGGQEQDRADYELFAWRVGTPWETAIRLTFSSGNDQWPDLSPR